MPARSMPVGKPNLVRTLTGKSMSKRVSTYGSSETPPVTDPEHEPAPPKSSTEPDAISQGDASSQLESAALAPATASLSVVRAPIGPLITGR